jgi:ABC-type nickel/cobalt efflux system permease component RcnA
MALSAAAWVVMIGSIALLWVPALWALFRTLRDEDRKLELLDEQGAIDTYSPEALAELRDWIRAHPDDEYAPEARERYNDCVETLRTIDEPFYDWSESEIEDLETISN